LTRNGWLFYAMGGGWGHLNRALSLARIVAREKPVTVITNCKQFEIISQARRFKDLVRNIEIVLSGSTTEDTVRSVSKAFETDTYSTIIVDTFPRGLIGELAEILPQAKHARKILIARDISPEYVRKYCLIDFVEGNFDLVINPGEGKDSSFSSLAMRTDPWLIEDDHEIPERHSIRENMRIVDSTNPVVLVCASGKDVDLFAQIAVDISRSISDVSVRLLTPNCPQDFPENWWISHWPGIECISACDLVIAAAGYNIINECAALAVPLIALPQKRLYDRQELRTASCFRTVRTAAECIGTVTNIISAGSLPIRERPSFKNGAREAYSLINRLSQSVS